MPRVGCSTDAFTEDHTVEAVLPCDLIWATIWLSPMLQGAELRVCCS